jgi:hypothetical protein
LIERSKPMSGDWLRVMIVRGVSTVTVVLSGGGAPECHDLGATAR